MGPTTTLYEPTEDFICSTLARVALNQKQRLANGMTLRTRLSKQLQSGFEPDHYRIDWIKYGVAAMIDELCHLGRSFNASHPNDKYSVHDMIDVLNSAVATLRRQVETDETEEGV